MTSIEIFTAISLIITAIGGAIAAIIKSQSTAESKALEREKHIQEMSDKLTQRLNDGLQSCEKDRAAQSQRITDLQQQFDRMLVTSQTGISDAQIKIDSSGMIVDCDGVPQLFRHKSSAVLHHPLSTLLTLQGPIEETQIGTAHHSGGFDVDVMVYASKLEEGYKLVIYPIKWRL